MRIKYDFGGASTNSGLISIHAKILKISIRLSGIESNEFFNANVGLKGNVREKWKGYSIVLENVFNGFRKLWVVGGIVPQATREINKLIKKNIIKYKLYTNVAKDNRWL